MNLFKKIIPVIALFLAACGTANNNEEINADRLNIVTTFYPMYHFTEMIVGENGNVTTLLKAGQDTHSYEPTPKDMAAIAEADVFVYSSEYMETWVPAVLETLSDSDVEIIDASAGIAFYEEEGQADEGEEHHDDEEHHEDDGHNHAVDPHVWLDPVYAKQMVETISSTIQAVDPENNAVYQENTAVYVKELETLDEEFQAAFQNAENRIFVVQHAAFGYLARRYELNEVSISALTSNQEVSPAKLAEIGNFINENQVQIIYYQDSGNNDLATTLAKETGIELSVLSAIEGITKSDQEAGIDYLTIMRKNLEALKRTIN